MLIKETYLNKISLAYLQYLRLPCIKIYESFLASFRINFLDLPKKSSAYKVGKV